MSAIVLQKYTPVSAVMWYVVDDVKIVSYLSTKRSFTPGDRRRNCRSDLRADRLPVAFTGGDYRGDRLRRRSDYSHAQLPFCFFFSEQCNCPFHAFLYPRMRFVALQKHNRERATVDTTSCAHRLRRWSLRVYSMLLFAICYLVV